MRRSFPRVAKRRCAETIEAFGVIAVVADSAGFSREMDSATEALAADRADGAVLVGRFTTGFIEPGERDAHLGLARTREAGRAPQSVQATGSTSRHLDVAVPDVRPVLDASKARLAGAVVGTRFPTGGAPDRDSRFTSSGPSIGGHTAEVGYFRARATKGDRLHTTGRTTLTGACRRLTENADGSGSVDDCSEAFSAPTPHP